MGLRVGINEYGEDKCFFLTGIRTPTLPRALVVAITIRLPYSEPDKFTSYFTIYFLVVHFNIIFQSKASGILAKSIEIQQARAILKAL